MSEETVVQVLPAEAAPEMKELPPTEDAKKSALDVIHNQMEVLVGKVRNFNGSKKQIQWVLEALAITPFNKNAFNFSYPEQKELYDSFIEVNNAKLVLLHVALEEQRIAKEIKERTDKPVEENTNGKQES